MLPTAHSSSSRALASFAGGYGPEFHRVDVLAEIGGQMRLLDLQTERVRAGTFVDDRPPLELYSRDIAIEYVSVGW